MREGGVPDPFLDGRGPWQPNHAVAALIQIVDERYVLQLRDPKPETSIPIIGAASVARSRPERGTKRP